MNFKLPKAFQGKRQIAAIVDQATVSGANFLTNVMIARFVGVSQFGTFALAWMAVLFAQSLQYALIISPMMSIGQKQEQERQPFYYGTAALHAACFAVASAVLVFVGVHLTAFVMPRWGISYLALPLSSVTFANLLQDFIRRYYFATARSTMALLNDGVSYLGQLPLLWALHTWHRLDAVNTLWCIFFTSIIALFVGLPALRELRFSRREIVDVTRTNWDFSRWLIPSAFMQWTSANLFVVSAPMYFGAAAAGILRGAQNLVAVAHIWFLGLDNVIPAEASREMHQAGTPALKKYLRRILLRWGSFNTAFMVCLAVAPHFWLHLAYGPKWVGSDNLLRLYALVYTQLFFNAPLKSGLMAIGFTKPLFWSNLAMTGFALVFAGPFIRWFGLTGAMFGILGTQTIFQSILGTSLIVEIRKIARREQFYAAEQLQSLS